MIMNGSCRRKGGNNKAFWLSRAAAGVSHVAPNTNCVRLKKGRILGQCVKDCDRRRYNSILQILSLVTLFIWAALPSASASRHTAILRPTKTLSSIAFPVKSGATVLHLRGGATRSPNKNKRGASIRTKTSSVDKKNDNGSPKKRKGRVETVEPQQNNRDENVPSIKAILIPRTLAIPQFIRLISVFLMTTALCGCVHTCGKPYTNAVRSFLPSDWNGVNAASTPSESVSSLEEYLAKKIAQGRNELLPPSFLPTVLPLLGIFTSLLLNIGFTILLPQWFVNYNVWIKYQRLDMNTLTPRQARIIHSKLETRQLDSETDEDAFYSSNLLSCSYSNLYDRNGTGTGLAVLVDIPKGDQAGDVTQNNVICHLYRSEQYRNDTTWDHPHPYYFELNQRRVYCNPMFDTAEHQSIQCTEGGPSFFTDLSLKSLLSSSVLNGLSDSSRLQIASERYGPYTHLTLPTPTVKSAFFHRISSPLAVLQLMGRLLTALEEDLGNSMLGLGMTLIYHYMNARKSIVAARELTREVQDNVADAAGMTVWVLRPKLTANKKKNRRKRKSWVKLKSSDLLPGDVFLIPSSSAPSLDASMNLPFIKNKHNNAVMPVDALLLDGTCICDEVVLTGESVPQCKVPLDPEDAIVSQNKELDDTFDHVTRLDMLGSHRGSVLFAGTTLMHCTNKASRVTTDEETDSKWPKELLPGNGSDEAPIKFLALRTGSYSSRGELLRALSKSNNGVGSISNAETERDALRLIFTLSLFAVAACISLFVPVKALDGSPKRPPISVFRKIVQCTRIVISSIPSELPLALSSVAHACSLKLRNSADVVCSQPASLITVAHVDIVVFDKTGTLTADTQNLKYLVHYKDSSVSPKEERKSSHKKRKKLKANKATSPHDISHPMADTVLAGCHSLFPMLVEDNEGTVESQIQSEDQRIRLLGDPVDQCSFRFTGWIHDFVEGCYKDSATSSKKMSSKNNNNKPIKIWQLKVFPFDPKRRRSSALVLCLHEDGDFRLWKLVKGSPDAMSRLLIEENGGNHLNSTLREPFADWYKDTNIHLGSEGLRVISMGAGDLTRDGHIVDLVFPQGLPKSLKEMKSSIGALASLIDAQTLLSIDTARSLARDNVHRDVVESFKQSSGSERPLDFVGFACFEAGLRPSTHRIVREIKQAGRHSLMLTGDGVDAAMAVAKEAGILAGAATAVLELTTEGVKQYLSWRLIRGDSKKGGKRRKSREGRSKTLSFTTKTVERIRQQNGAGLCDVVATGAAIDFLLCHLSRRSGLVGNDKSRCHDALQNQLPGLAVVAGASPQTKQRVIDALRQGGKKKVLMCGDGVNDVAAMKMADVSVSLLNGYGQETGGSSGGWDTEEDRRRQKLAELKIGKNRAIMKVQSQTAPSADDDLLDCVGNTRAAALARVKLKISQAMMTQTSESSSETLKRIAASIWNAIKVERIRVKTLDKGGGGAARILAEDEKLRKSLERKSKATDDGDVSTVCDDDGVMIKPGEACLAAAFTCLRPCIDGVDALMRAGIAAAAFSLFTHRVIALNCLMSCYNLSTLYRDGFRYGKKMWPVESLLMSNIDHAAYEAASTPCPRIGRTRLPASIFHPSSLSVVIQAFVHLSTLFSAVRVARRSESSFSQTKGFQIRWISPETSAQSNMSMDSIIQAIAAAGSSPERDEIERESMGALRFGRRPFRPNYVTNVVFLMSIWQNAVVGLVNHMGRPFCRDVLESRPLCLSIGAALLFCLVCTSESLPELNHAIELAPMAKEIKRHLIILFVLDLGCSLAADRLLSFLFKPQEFKLHIPSDGTPGKESIILSAADAEEALLRDEVKQNRSILFAILIIMFHLAARSVSFYDLLRL